MSADGRPDLYQFILNSAGYDHPYNIVGEIPSCNVSPYNRM